MTADPRVTAARAFLAAAKQRKFADKPDSVLDREAAELRHQLGQVLKVIDEADEPGWGTCGVAGILSLADVQTLLSALSIAAKWAGMTARAGAREQGPADRRRAAAYRELADRLGGDS